MKRLCILIIVAMAGLCFGSELHVGVGYGPQVDRQKQKNGVLDLTYVVKSYQKGWFGIGIGGGYSYLWSDIGSHDALHVGSLIVPLRIFLPEIRNLQPFFCFSFNPSIMSGRELGYQSEGTRFVFNDFVALGVYFGTDKKWSVSYRYRHFSNGGLFVPNDGIDVPFEFAIGHVF